MINIEEELKKALLMKQINQSPPEEASGVLASSDVPGISMQAQQIGNVPTAPPSGDIEIPQDMGGYTRNVDTGDITYIPESNIPKTPQEYLQRELERMMTMAPHQAAYKLSGGQGRVNSLINALSRLESKDYNRQQAESEKQALQERYNTDYERQKELAGLKFGQEKELEKMKLERKGDGSISDRINLLEYELKRNKDKRDQAKEERELESERKYKETVATMAGTVIEDTDRALDIIDKYGNLSAGIGGITNKIIGSPAKVLQGHIDSVKSNIGIDKLLDIKKSGAGLGQVPQQQLETLQSTLGNLDITQPPEVLEYNLMRVKRIYDNIAKNAEQEGLDISQGAKKITEQYKQNAKIPARAIEALRSNPELKDQFESYYGVSANDYL